MDEDKRTYPANDSDLSQDGPNGAPEAPEQLIDDAQNFGEDPGFALIEDVAPLVPRKKKRGKNSRRRRRKNRRTAVIALLCTVIGVATLMLGYLYISNQKRQAAEIAAQQAAEEALRLEQERQQQEFEAMSSSTVFLEGITVDGVAIGGMSMEQARTALSSVAQQAQNLGELQLTYQDQIFSMDLNSIAASHNLESILAEAYRLGKTGDYETMKAETQEVKLKGKAYSIQPSYDMLSIGTKVAEIAAKIDALPKDAAVSSVDTENHAITFSDEVVGVTVEQAVLTQSIADAVMSKNLTPIAIPVLETQPLVKRADLEGKYVLRAKFSTDFSTSTAARKYNIKKGAGIINGTVLKSGETFSTNDTLGTRTEGNGWKLAGAYENGATVEQAGGGVCQLSTTLYNTVVRADLEIVSRRNHSMPVAYIDKGLDATINSVGNIIDFQFKNNTLNDIVIFGYTTNSKTLTFEIWGLPFATEEYDEIKLSSKQVSKTEPDGQPNRIEKPEGTEKPNGSQLQAGEEFVAVSPRTGYKYQSYKNYYKNGTLVKSEPLATSTYKVFNGEIWVCSTTASPSPSPVTTPTPDGVVDPSVVITPDPNYNGNVLPVIPDSQLFY